MMRFSASSAVNGLLVVWTTRQPLNAVRVAPHNGTAWVRDGQGREERPRAHEVRGRAASAPPAKRRALPDFAAVHAGGGGRVVAVGAPRRVAEVNHPVAVV